MTNIFSFVWDVDPVAFSIGNFLSIHWLLIFSFVGLLIGFELFLYQIKNTQDEIIQVEKSEKLFSSPFNFFALAVLLVIFGAKLFSLIFHYADNTHISEFSAVGGILFLVITCFVFFNRLPIFQAYTLDKTMFAFMIFMAFYQFGQIFEYDTWGRATNSQKGGVFTNQATVLLEGIFDKVESIDVVDKREESIDETAFPLNLDIQFIEEVNNQEDIDGFLNTEFKDALVGFKLVNSHFKNKSDENLDYTITQLADGKYQAQINIDGIARHPLSIYKGLLAIAIFLTIIFFQNKGVINSVGEQSAWIIILWLTLQMLIDFFFSVDFSWSLISESTLSLLLILTSVYYLFNTEKVLAFNKKEA